MSPGFRESADVSAQSKAASPRVVRSRERPNDGMQERLCCGLFNPAKAGLEGWGDCYHGLKPVAIDVHPFGIDSVVFNG